jgi:hypothetical protein
MCWLITGSRSTAAAVDNGRSDPFALELREIALIDWDSRHMRESCDDGMKMIRIERGLKWVEELF